MASAGFYRDLVNNNPALLAQILAFNCRSGREQKDLADPSLQKAVSAFPDLARKLSGPSAHRDVNREGYWAFASPSERLALLPPDELAVLGKMTAASLLSERIAHSVMQADVLAIKQALGTDIYHWVLCRGRFLPGSLVHDVLPFCSEGAVADLLIQLARSSLETVRAGWPDMLQKQAEPIFASLALPDADPLASNDELSTKFWFLMRKIILQEFDKKWTPFFN